MDEPPGILQETGTHGTSPGRYQYLLRDGSEASFVAEGTRLSRKHRQEEALYWFDRALQKRPDYPPALLGKAFALGKMGRYDEEIRCCDRVLAEEPGSVDALIEKAYALGKLGRFAEKIACCDQGS